jgi:hypothetical protein
VVHIHTATHHVPNHEVFFNKVSDLNTPGEATSVFEDMSPNKLLGMNPKERYTSILGGPRHVGAQISNSSNEAAKQPRFQSRCLPEKKDPPPKKKVSAPNPPGPGTSQTRKCPW